MRPILCFSLPWCLALAALAHADEGKPIVPVPAKESPPAIAPTPPASTSAPTPPIDPAQIARWITELNDDRYEVREAATRKLGEAGRAAADPLANAALGDNLEVSVRAVRALQMLYLNADESVYSAAESALEKLSGSANQSVARRALAASGSKVVVQQERAVRRLEALGAVIKYQAALGRIPRGQHGERIIDEIHLNESWKGGDEGLSFLRKLSTQRSRLYVIDGAGVSEEAVEGLISDVPGLQVQRRGRALLGVMGQTTASGCEIVEVKAGTGAEKAGLQPGDVLLKYDGTEVKSFDDVIAITKRKSVGDKVDVQVLRVRGNNATKEQLTVTLTGWR